MFLLGDEGIMTIGYDADADAGIDAPRTSRRSLRTPPRSTVTTGADLAGGGNPS
jgi:hypothetical protein